MQPSHSDEGSMCRMWTGPNSVRECTHTVTFFLTETETKHLYFHFPGQSMEDMFDTFVHTLTLHGIIRGL